MKTLPLLLAALALAACSEAPTPMPPSNVTATTASGGVPDQALNFAVSDNLRDAGVMMEVDIHASAALLDCADAKIKALQAWALRIDDARVRGKYLQFLSLSADDVRESRSRIVPPEADSIDRNLALGREIAASLPQPPDTGPCVQSEPLTFKTGAPMIIGPVFTTNGKTK